MTRAPHADVPHAEGHDRARPNPAMTAAVRLPASPLARTFGPSWLMPGAEIRIRDDAGRLVTRGMLSDDGLSIIAADGVTRVALTLKSGWEAELRVKGERCARSIRAA